LHFGQCLPCCSETGNRNCADCGALDPRWASTNLGIFICLSCCGIHRSLGTHISKVKSCNLDVWQEDQIEFMKSMGNNKAKEIWEAKVPPNYKRHSSASSQAIVQKWIFAKYEDKEFKGDPPSPQLPSTPQKVSTTAIEQLVSFDSNSKSPSLSQKVSTTAIEQLVNFDSNSKSPSLSPKVSKHSDALSELFGDSTPSLNSAPTMTPQLTIQEPIKASVAPSRTTIVPNYNPSGMGYSQQPQYPSVYGNNNPGYGVNTNYTPQQQYTNYALNSPPITLSPSPSPQPVMKRTTNPPSTSTQQPKKSDPFAELFEQMK